MSQKATKNHKDLLRKLYYSAELPSAFGSLKTLWKAAKKQDPSISFRMVKKWAETQPIPTIFGPITKKFERSKFMVSGPNSLWQADLFELPSLARYNKNFRYCLVVCDVWSTEIIEAIAQKKKTSKITAENFERIFQTKGTCRKLQTDQGREFLVCSTSMAFLVAQ